MITVTPTRYNKKGNPLDESSRKIFLLKQRKHQQRIPNPKPVEVQTSLCSRIAKQLGLSTLFKR